MVPVLRKQSGTSGYTLVEQVVRTKIYWLSGFRAPAAATTVGAGGRLVPGTMLPPRRIFMSRADGATPSSTPPDRKRAPRDDHGKHSTRGNNVQPSAPITSAKLAVPPGELVSTAIVRLILWGRFIMDHVCFVTPHSFDASIGNSTRVCLRTGHRYFHGGSLGKKGLWAMSNVAFFGHCTVTGNANFFWIIPLLQGSVCLDSLQTTGDVNGSE